MSMGPVTASVQLSPGSNQPSTSVESVTPASTTTDVDEQADAPLHLSASQPRLPPQLQMLPHSPDLLTPTLPTASEAAAPTEQASPEASATAGPTESRRERRRARRQEKKAEVTHHLFRLGNMAREDLNTACNAATSAWSDVSSTVVHSLGAAQKAVHRQVSHLPPGDSNSLESSVQPQLSQKTVPTLTLQGSVGAPCETQFVTMPGPVVANSQYLASWFSTLWPGIRSALLLVVITSSTICVLKGASFYDRRHFFNITNTAKCFARAVLNSFQSMQDLLILFSCYFYNCTQFSCKTY